MPPAVFGPPDAEAGADANARYLAALERELADWDARLARVGRLPRKSSRAARVDQRKRILVSKVRHRNIVRRLAEMRDASQDRFGELRPGLQLLWKMFTSGIEKAES